MLVSLIPRTQPVRLHEPLGSDSSHLQQTESIRLTPRGTAIVQLIRADWLRGIRHPWVRNERFADLIAPLNLSREDVAAVAALWAAHYTD